MANSYTSSQLNDEKKTVGKGSIHLPRLVDPKKDFHFMSGVENDPPAPFSVQNFAELNKTFPFTDHIQTSSLFRYTSTDF